PERRRVEEPESRPCAPGLAYVRDTQLRVVDADGSRDVVVTEMTGMSFPRWSPDGRLLAFVGRRRGWSQVWLVDAPIPRRGRPAPGPPPPAPAPAPRHGV